MHIEATNEIIENKRQIVVIFRINSYCKYIRMNMWVTMVGIYGKFKYVKQYKVHNSIQMYLHVNYKNYCIFSFINHLSSLIFNIEMNIPLRFEQVNLLITSEQFRGSL